MPDEHSDRRIVVVDARNVVAANTAAKTVDTVGGEKTFTAGLSPTGNAPPTHYVCNWAMTPEEAAAFHGGIDGLIQAGRAWEYDADDVTPDQVLTQMGLKPVVYRFP